MDRSKRAISAFILVGAIAVPGVINYFLAQSGLSTLGTIVWVLGYGAGVLGLWYIWLRPLDLSGPGESDLRDADERPNDRSNRPQQGESVANDE